MVIICVRSLRLVSPLILLFVLAVGTSASQYTRQEAPFTPAKMHIINPMTQRANITVKMIAYAVNPGMTEQEYWFIRQEIKLLNPAPVETYTVPVYRPYTGGRSVCSDIRNWHVAVFKGKKYGVLPALLVAIRSHENPERRRDSYAYGVLHLKGTNLWTQAEGAAEIIAHIAKSQGWSPLSPTRSKLLRLARAYVGRGDASARKWSRSVYTMMGRCLP